MDNMEYLLVEQEEDQFTVLGQIQLECFPHSNHVT